MPKGRITKALAGFYYVESEGRTVQCRGRGVFRKRNVSPLVGDIVTFQAENDRDGYIMDIDERETELVRPPISNVDQALLVFSAKNPQFSTTLLDRFLTLVEFHRITPVICITKWDLCSDEEKKEIEKYIEDYKQMDYDVFVVAKGIESDHEKLLPLFHERITVIAGQSGVGKSTLLNTLRPDLQLKTNEISEVLGRGKHTTRHVELLHVGDGLVADTPGFSSLEFINIETNDLSSCFVEIDEMSVNCKFRGCTHINEPKCAVKDAVNNGDIQQYRYDHYVHFFEEIKDRKPRY